jgi:hypothetical protein
MEKTICLWRWDDAPAEYKALSTNGGDEDWVVFVPVSVVFNWTPNWLYNIDSCHEPQVIEVAGGTVYIGSHA